MAPGRVAIEFNAPVGRGFWLAAFSEIAALEKRAGRAGNRYGCDLGVRLTNLNRRTNHELKSR
jgi:hypothetical protein